MNQTRILIVLESGAFKGASVTDESGTPLPVDAVALAEILPAVNAAALAESDTIRTTHAAEISTLRADAPEEAVDLVEATLEKSKESGVKLADLKLFVVAAAEEKSLSGAQREARGLRKQAAEAIAKADEIEAKAASLASKNS